MDPRKKGSLAEHGSDGDFPSSSGAVKRDDPRPLPWREERPHFGAFGPYLINVGGPRALSYHCCASFMFFREVGGSFRRLFTELFMSERLDDFLEARCM